MRKWQAVLVGVVSGVLLVAGTRSISDPVRTWLARARPPQPTVLFVVWDTVRADRLSLCGYDRPTSPLLDQLAREGATHSCHAYAPGSWTLPSHASFFTGLPVTAHGADYAPSETAAVKCGTVNCAAGGIFGDTAVRTLDAEAPTLAERFVARGYQAVALSQNPVVSEVTGLTRGFEHVWAPAGWDPADGERLVDELVRVLRSELERDRPLFLFVNLGQAHDPYAGVPAGVSWVAERPPLQYHHSDELYERFLRDEMSAGEREAFLAHARDAYDWGVWRDDYLLGRVLDVLGAHDWDVNGLRLVVTSDHGENQGEHDLLGHGVYLYEPTARVFLLHHDSAGAVAGIPSPISALAVHDLVLDGRLPEELPPVVATGRPSVSMSARTRGRFGNERTVAGWNGREKMVIRNGEGQRYDLDLDPGERSPTPLTDPQWEQRLRALDEAVQAAEPGTSGEDVQELLRAVGYVE